MQTEKRKPVVGITPCSTMGDYRKSVELAGAEILELRNDEDPETVLDRVDGLVLTGGPDVDPSRYGQAKHLTTKVAPERDRFELPLAEEAIKRNVPLFAICRGLQVLNVAEGGTLTQDIPSELETRLNHSINQPKTHHTHTIEVVSGSQLARALGSAAEAGTLKVNSRHHQALNQVAPNFVVSAVAPDGIIEAIERPASTFCVGVQWHPENFWQTGEFAGLFRDFIAAASAHTTKP